MNQVLPEKITGKPRILVAPLDWGLGHATRCIPVIRELQSQGADIWLATSGAAQELLQAEFPSLPFLRLPGYQINYARTRTGMIWKMIGQGPKMRRAIQYERAWLGKKIIEYGFDAVISDNRYGLHHKKIPCIFITHQLTIKSPLGKWTEKVLQKKNYQYIHRFTGCWVPDREYENNLAGELSHPLQRPVIPLRYIGPLSRFKKKEMPEKTGHLLFLLSGPEPQRSILENKIIAEISHYNGTATLVRGLPGSRSLIPSTNMLKFYNHLPADDLNILMQEAEYIISRSGYSTIMDAMLLQKKTIMIPTPGQTEQEYLAHHMMKNQWAFCIKQKDFSLAVALEKAKHFYYRLPVLAAENKLEQVIRELISSLP